MMGYRQFLPFVPALLIGGCASFGGLSKLQFDLGKLNSEGLQGPEDGLRALSYEFCIPGRLELVNEVMEIDKTLVVYREAPGRAGCSGEEYLAVGNTAQDDYLKVLKKLTELDYVKEIREVFFE